MAVNWIGSVVSIDCGEILGSYQGIVSGVDETHQTITLNKCYRDGVHCKLAEITICSQDIQGLKILKSAKDDSDVCRGDASIKANFTKPVSKVHLDPSSTKTEDRRRTQSVSEVGQRKAATTPKKNDNRRKCQDKDDACFSAPVDNFILENEFDFEMNLALFDKQAVFDEINAASKPDVVRLVDCNRRPQTKYRCDENVIESGPVVLRQISVAAPEKKEFITDTGLIVPSIHQSLRERLFAAAEKHGLTPGRQLEMIGRSATEMVVQLLGGGHRLNPQNSHQKPVVVVLCGAHFQGLQGISCGRHLANRGANVILFFPCNTKMMSLIASELALYRLTEGKTVSTPKDLPNGLVDLVVSAFDGHGSPDVPKDKPAWHWSVENWASHCRAPVLTLDPPQEGPSVTTRWSVVPGLPLSLESAGSVYLCDVGIPTKVFLEIGIRYCSPFGPKFVVPLHEKSG